MKIIYLVVLGLIFAGNVYGQQTGSFIELNEIPKGLTISVDEVSRPRSFMEMKCLASAKFSNQKKAITYDIFAYSPADSLVYSQMRTQRLLMENCRWRGGKNLDKSFPITFIRGDYFFLLEFCACGGTSKGPCGDLAIKVNKWLKNNKTAGNKNE